MIVAAASFPVNPNAATTSVSSVDVIVTTFVDTVKFVTTLFAVTKSVASEEASSTVAV